jgi:hypothetical protein
VVDPDNPQYQVILQGDEAADIAFEIRARMWDSESMGAPPEMVTEEAQKEIDALRQTNPGLADEVTNILRDSAGISLSGGSSGSFLEAPIPMQPPPQGVAGPDAPVKWQDDDQAKANAKALEEKGIFPPGDDGTHGLGPEPKSKGIMDSIITKVKTSEYKTQLALRKATWDAYQLAMEGQDK